MSNESKIEFSFGDLEKTHAENLESSPEANVAAIEAHAAGEEAKLREQASNVDKYGTIFDANLHAVNKDGEPSLTPTGKFRKKRGTGSRVATQSDAAKTIQDEAAARAAGQLAADMLIGGAVTLLGPEWVPIGETGEQEPMKFDEHSNMRKAFGDYFVAKNINDFPPGIALTIAVTSYAGARLAAGKETQSRLSKAWSWASGGFRKLYRRINKNAAHDNTRDNGVRKDDAGKEPVSPVEDS